jgi:protein-S-isoprenylcysteine O-methyltransferase Ste14
MEPYCYLVGVCAGMFAMAAIVIAVAACMLSSRISREEQADAE